MVICHAADLMHLPNFQKWDSMIHDSNRNIIGSFTMEVVMFSFFKRQEHVLHKLIQHQTYKSLWMIDYDSH